MSLYKSNTILTFPLLTTVADPEIVRPVSTLSYLSSEQNLYFVGVATFPVKNLLSFAAGSNSLTQI